MAWHNYGGKPKNSKYGARKAVLDGVKFDSQKEARRFAQLQLLEKAGEISDLKRQVRFELIPAHYEYYQGKDGKPRKGACIERSCYYLADFVYLDKDGVQVVEDAKGFRTDAYVIKRKLMLHVHGIRIKEV